MTSLDTNSYLQDHALRNVWCNPFQDSLSTIKPHRITPYNGVNGTVKIMWGRHDLPDKTSFFHAYQIGQIHPELLGLLPPTTKGWIKVSDVMGQRSLIVELFTSVGLQLPRSDCYYKWTTEKNLVFIVKDMTHLGVKLGEETLFVRLYASNFFHSGVANSSGVRDYIFCSSVFIATQAQHNAIIQTYNNYFASRGVAVRAYVNGFLVKTLSPATCKMGDTAEVLVDTSIRAVLTYQISDLLQFRSIRDQKYKYLLKSPTEGIANAEIIYSDDVDMYLIDSSEPIANKGVCYYQNQPDSVRMVTHVDYAVPVAYLDDSSGRINAWGGTKPLALRLFIRHTGNSRALMDEANRIKELYKLPFNLASNAMLGIDAVVPNWRAEVLENSAYVKLMGADYNGITLDMVEEAYGYNAISKLVGDNPVAPVPGTTGTYAVPYLMRFKSTAYEYDANGVLINSYWHMTDEYYAARNLQTRLVEFVYGHGNTEDSYSIYGTDPVAIPDATDFRCYVCSLDVFGNSMNNWHDVTATGAYLVTGNTLTWGINPLTQQGMVRLESGFMTYSVSLPIDNLGYMVHSLIGADPKALSKLQFVPHAQYDYWLNGHPLVEGIDYIQRSFNLIIFSKAYLVNGTAQAQTLTVRGTGFCNSQLQRDAVMDVGFVKYNLLSYNDVFNVRDDKVMRITVAGALKQRSDYVFAEDAKVFNSLAAINGKPYQIRDMITPITKLVNTDVYAMRAASMATDIAVSNYLSIKMPAATPYYVNTTPSLYPLYSPFLACMIASYLSGQFNPDILTQEYGDAELMQACLHFEWMLGFDPTQDANRPDPEYCIIHPHAGEYVIEVPLNFYTFLVNVVRVYLHNRVNLSAFLSIAAV